MDKRKLAIALLAVAIVGVLSGGAVYAYFSDTESTPGPKFTAGTLDLELTPGGSSGTVTVQTGDEHVYPGYSKTANIELKNAGNIGGTLTVTINNINDLENGIVEPEADLDQTSDKGELSGSIYVTIKEGDNTLVDNILLKEVSDKDLGDLAAGETKELTFTYTVSTDAGNEIQSDSATFDVEFTLKQKASAA